MLKEKMDEPVIKDFDKCDFQPIRNHLEQQKVSSKALRKLAMGIHLLDV